MAGKIFTSPGISARPLNVFERLREWWRYDHSLRFWLWELNYRYNPKYRKHRAATRQLIDALNSGHYAIVPSGDLQVEDLSATMSVVTFDATKLRLK